MKLVSKVEFTNEEKSFLETLANVCIQHEDCCACPLSALCNSTRDDSLSVGVDRLLDGQ